VNLEHVDLLPLTTFVVNAICREKWPIEVANARSEAGCLLGRASLLARANDPSRPISSADLTISFPLVCVGRAESR
jgi:hypothetical protein